MIDLPFSGLPIQLDPKLGILYFDSSVKSETPSVRKLEDAIFYYESRNNLKNEIPLYYMYRDVRRIADDEAIQKSVYRYDLTVIQPGKVGEESIKTIGHVHPISKHSKIPYTYTEVYSVIYGTAHYVLQKFNQELTSISDIVVLTVHEGEHVLIPSFYGHVTVNTTEKPLVMANILFRDFKSLYEPYLTNQGAAVYLKLNNKNEILISPNQNYSVNVLPRKANANDFPAPYLNENIPLYHQWIEQLEKFTYLYQPN